MNRERLGLIFLNFPRLRRQRFLFLTALFINSHDEIIKMEIFIKSRVKTSDLYFRNFPSLAAFKPWNSLPLIVSLFLVNIGRKTVFVCICIKVKFSVCFEKTLKRKWMEEDKDRMAFNSSLIGKKFSQTFTKSLFLSAYSTVKSWERARDSTSSLVFIALYRLLKQI